MSDEQRVALVRAAWQSFLQFGGVFLSTFTVSNDARTSLLAAGLAAFIALGYRGVAEGQYDTVRNRREEIRGYPVIDPDARG